MARARAWRARNPTAKQLSHRPKCAQTPNTKHQRWSLVGFPERALLYCRVVVDQYVQDLSDGPFSPDGFTPQEMALDLVAVATAVTVFLFENVAGRGEVGNDGVGAALGDPQSAGLMLVGPDGVLRVMASSSEAMRACGVDLARPGGHVANIGVHGAPATLHPERLWAADVTITTGLVDTYSTPTLLRLVPSHQLNSAQFVTHHFALDQFGAAYDTFARAADTKALKVVLNRA